MLDAAQTMPKTVICRTTNCKKAHPWISAGRLPNVNSEDLLLIRSIVPRDRVGEEIYKNVVGSRQRSFPVPRIVPHTSHHPNFASPTKAPIESTTTTSPRQPTFPSRAPLVKTLISVVLGHLSLVTFFILVLHPFTSPKSLFHLDIHYVRGAGRGRTEMTLVTLPSAFAISTGASLTPLEAARFRTTWSRRFLAYLSISRTKGENTVIER